ncbi:MULTISPECIES: response regulator [unclassified Aureimonas]|uniref:response regulator n=1 Tax=unclassified Aureimonas TaxID=2615206 RepID=UPI0006FAF0C4|nr:MULTISPECIES: response regulator [unclassified Aureimonas]KQT69075.1 two-component system response regulator [Aureimonas sp. Leaf460]KQT69313.1 two-component system response regulator [Aureimonas sp. Leaf427]
MAHALIIDDSSTVRMFYREVLEAEGFAVDEAINGLEGLEKVMSEAFDVVLVDVNMPRMDGYTFLKEMRAMPETQGLPAVMISTEAKPEDQTKAYASGANIYMVKPVHPTELAAIVRLVTGAAPAQRTLS